jgi:putative redox protein
MSLLTANLSHGDYGITVQDANQNSFTIDIPVAQGGLGQGMRPMQLLLAALMGCSEVDIVAILKKQKQEIETFYIAVDGNREEGKEPSLWQTVHLHYTLTGTLESAKVLRAVQLSIDKYCSVAETLRRSGTHISYTVTVNGEQIIN